MTTLQTDAYWAKQQSLIENFSDLLEDDYTEADNLWLHYQTDPNINRATFKRMEVLRSEHLSNKCEQDREDWITFTQKHV